MNHYTYLLQSKTDDMMYIGVRSCKCLPEEDNYWGSSKHLPKNVSDICDKFILGTFDSRKEALQDEINRHNINNVAKNPNFWNKAKQTSTGWNTAGTTISNELKKRISIAHQGLKHSEETKLKMSEARNNYKHSEETKLKIGNANRGRKQKTSSCPHCNKIGSISNMVRWHFNNCKEFINVPN